MCTRTSLDEEYLTRADFPAYRLPCTRCHSVGTKPATTTPASSCIAMPYVRDAHGRSRMTRPRGREFIAKFNVGQRRALRAKRCVLNRQNLMTPMLVVRDSLRSRFIEILVRIVEIIWRERLMKLRPIITSWNITNNAKFNSRDVSHEIRPRQMRKRSFKKVGDKTISSLENCGEVKKHS